MPITVFGILDLQLFRVRLSIIDCFSTSFDLTTQWSLTAFSRQKLRLRDAVCGALVSAFVVHRRPVSERGMSPMRIVRPSIHFMVRTFLCV
jgi:hypothetical protein